MPGVPEILTGSGIIRLRSLGPCFLLTEAFAPGFQRNSIWGLIFVRELRRGQFMKKRKIAERAVADLLPIDPAIQKPTFGGQARPVTIASW